MSATSTDNATAIQIQRTLNDYHIRLTGEDAELPEVAAPNQSVEIHSSNPAGWPQNYRNVPSYRPINRSLDRSLRPGGSNAIEQAFLYIMFRGVWLNAVSRI